MVDKEALKANAIPLAIIGIVLGGGLVVSNTGISLPGTASIASQACVSGISDVRIGSNDDDLNFEEYFKADIVTPCSDQLITGGSRINPEQLETTRSDGTSVKPERAFDIAFQNFEAKGVQKIREGTSKILYGVESRKEVEGERIDCGRWGCGDDAKQKCEDFQNGNSVSHYKLDQSGSTGDVIATFELACTRATKIAEYAEFESSTKNDISTDVKLCVDGKGCETVTVTQKEGTKTINNGDQKAKIQWTGNLQGSLFDINFPRTDFRAVCGNDCKNEGIDDTYTITTDDLISDYETSVNNFPDEFEKGTSKGSEKTVSQVVTNHQTDVSNVQSDQSQALKSTIGSWVENIEWGSSGLEIIPKDAGDLAVSTFTVQMGAGWIGVFEPSAQPRVEDPGSINMKAQTRQEVNVDITNQDTEDSAKGTIEVEGECPSSSPLRLTSDTLYNVPTGSTRTATLELRAQTSETTGYSCNIIAYDKGFPDKTRSTGELKVNVESSCPDSDGDGVCNDGTDVCPSTPAATEDGCPLEETQCDDGEDNDNDGVADKEDSDCDDPSRDRDGDGIPDKDDECPMTGPTGATQVPASNIGSNGCEKGTPTTEQKCEDGLDNDEDGLIDEADPDCQSDGSNFPIVPILVGVVVIAVGYGIYQRMGSGSGSNRKRGRSRRRRPRRLPRVRRGFRRVRRRIRGGRN